MSRSCLLFLDSFLRQMSPHPFQAHIIGDLTSLGKYVLPSSDKIGGIEARLELGRHKLSFLS